MGWDIAILESGDGGDFSMRGSNDIQVTMADENEIYLRMFGGNYEADSKNQRLPGEEDNSYWGNSHAFPEDRTIQFNSFTERALRKCELSSEGRQRIENAIKKDLQGMNVTVEVSIIGTDKVRAVINETLANGVSRKLAFTYNRSTHVPDFDLSDFSAIDFK